MSGMADTPTRARDTSAGPLPGGGLTKAGQRLVAVLLDPAYRHATVRQRAKAARISEPHYYRLMKDEAVHEALRLKARELLAPYLAPILATAVETASQPGRDGHQDRRMLLEMAAWYGPRQQMEISGPGGSELRIRFVDPGQPAESESESESGW